MLTSDFKCWYRRHPKNISDEFYVLIKKGKCAIHFEMEGLLEENIRKASDSSKEAL